MGIWNSHHLQAQQPPQDAIIATTLFETQFTGPPKGPATLSVATIALAPGQASLPLEGRGSLLILVESGSVTLLTNHAIDALSANTGDNTGGPGAMYRLNTGQRVTIPYIGAIQFRNEGDQPSSLLLLTLTPEGGPS